MKITLLKFSRKSFLFVVACGCLLSSARAVYPQSCLSLGGANPATRTENFNNLGASPAPRNDQSANLTNLSSLPPVNPPASRFLGRFDNTLNDAGAAVNVPWAEIEEGAVSSTVSGRYNVGDGSNAGGNTYSFAGTAAPADRALGSQTNGDAARNLLGACFVNTTGATISTVYVNYTGEQWRNGGSNIADRLDFQYAVDATPASSDNIFTANGGVFTDFNALDFASPVSGATAGALDGNAAANRRVFAPTAISVSIPADAVFYVRWIDARTGGGTNDDGLAIDDFGISLLAPSAANVSIGGRVASEKTGIAGARVSLTALSGERRSTVTNQFGYYVFDNTAIGDYVISVQSRKYYFAEPVRVVTAAEDLREIDFFAEN